MSTAGQAEAPEKAEKPEKGGKRAEEKTAEGKVLSIEDIVSKASRAAEKASSMELVFQKRELVADKTVSFGSLHIDRITGGGLPPGRIVGIFGPEGAGKSLLADEVLHNQLRAGRVGVKYDAEGTADPIFLKARGIDYSKYLGKRNKNGELNPGQRDLIYYYQPETGQQMLNHMVTVCDALPENRNAPFPPVVFVTDSVVALIPEALQADMDANKMAAHAIMYSQMMPIIRGRLSRTGCSWLYINQLRQKPGVTYGSPFYEPAGDALKFFSSMRIGLESSKPKHPTADMDHPFVGDGSITGAVPKAGGVWQEPHTNEAGTKTGEGLDKYKYTSVKTIKNKVYNPFKSCWIRTQFEENGDTGRGLDKVYDVFTFLLAEGYLTKAYPRKDQGEKAENVKGMFEVLATPDFDPRSVGIPERFNYWQWKKWVGENPQIQDVLREKLIVSGIVYRKSEGG